MKVVGAGRDWFMVGYSIDDVLEVVDVAMRLVEANTSRDG